MSKNFTKYTLFISIFTFLSACTTLNPETGEQEKSNTKTGAAVGAATGALMGALVGKNVKAAAIGAGVGALAGAGVGAYMDKQERELRKDLEGTGVEVTRDGDNIQLNMPSSITFDSGKAVVKPQFTSVIKDIGGTLSKYESTIVNVAGHTDSVGSAEFNQQLSVNRANSVRDELVRSGVIQERLVTTGYGESMPVADNASESGRQQNRRVEITLQPLVADN